jgi:hypothetical protein
LRKFRRKRSCLKMRSSSHFKSEEREEKLLKMVGADA